MLLLSKEYGNMHKEVNILTFLTFFEISLPKFFFAIYFLEHFLKVLLIFLFKNMNSR